MLVKTETIKTIWVGMSKDQKVDIATALNKLEISSRGARDDLLTDEELEAVNSLRQALLNV